MARPIAPLPRHDPGARAGGDAGAPSGPGTGTPATHDPAALGNAPPDGDFARLLEAASRPAAHRIGPDPARSVGGIDRLAALRDRIRDAAPAPATDATAHDGDARRAEAPSDSRGAPEGEAAGASDRIWGRSATGAVERPAPRTAAVFAGRSLRERIVGIAVVIVVLWSLAVVLGRAMDTPDDAFGMLIVLGFVAFLVLRGRLRRRRD